MINERGRQTSDIMLAQTAAGSRAGPVMTLMFFWFLLLGISMLRQPQAKAAPELGAAVT